jgi:hypothetical protein
LNFVHSDNNAISRPRLGKATAKQNEDGEPWSPQPNTDAWIAMEQAVSSMHDYTEEFDRAVIMYRNGFEIVLTKTHALTLVYEFRPSSVVIFMKPSALGRCTPHFRCSS